MNEHHLEFLSLKGGCTGSSESTLVKMSYCRSLIMLLTVYKDSMRFPHPAFVFCLFFKLGTVSLNQRKHFMMT